MGAEDIKNILRAALMPPIFDFGIWVCRKKKVPIVTIELPILDSAKLLPKYRVD